MINFFSTVSIVALFISCIGVDTGNAQKSDESKLLANLKKTYHGLDRYARPVANHEDAVKVTAGITLDSFGKHDESAHTLDALAYVSMMWVDNKLTWDPADYNGIKSTRMPVDHIWSPDLVFYNAVYSPQDLSRFYALVYNDGSVIYVPQIKIAIPLVTTSSTDQIKGQLRLGSWTHHKGELDLQLGTYDDVTGAERSRFWKVKDFSTEIKNTLYPCCVEKYPSAQYNFTIAKLF